jgi:hypothetical protein
MKFCKVLKKASDEMPMMSDLFLRYKELKKKLKAIPKGEAPPDERHPTPCCRSTAAAGCRPGSLPAADPMHPCCYLLQAQTPARAPAGPTRTLTTRTRRRSP